MKDKNLRNSYDKPTTSMSGRAMVIKHFSGTLPSNSPKAYEGGVKHSGDNHGGSTINQSNSLKDSVDRLDHATNDKDV